MSLDANDLVTLSRLLDQALDLPSSESRAAWLGQLPSEHQALKPLLAEMLAEHERDPCEHPAGIAPSGALQALLGVASPLDHGAETDPAVPAAGERVGPYRLLREIGRGGMGTVWLAERADGAFERQVALKLPRLAWGAGLARRMAREREIGALLEHPAIARLYDAGVDELGRPYLAFEHIAGQAIDTWCEQRALPVSARLRLLADAARAVAYAHGRLVVHRDLKPSNILVSDDGQVHLLDFGIAKRLEEAAGEHEHGLTQEWGRVLTPHYASPEQLRGQAITVQSDVFSLGMLGYALLSGRLPRGERCGVGIDPAWLDGELPTASSQAHDADTARALRGEVDAILAKAVKGDPAERYASAEALASDIEHHLAHEPVLARPDGPWRRCVKLIRRHRAGFAATAAVALAVLAGAGVALAQARRANLEAERARLVKDFVVDVFRLNARDEPRKTELRQLPVELLLDHGAQLIERRFVGQPELQAELYGTVSSIFVDMSSPQQAVTYARKALATLEQTGAAADARAQALLQLAQAQSQADQLAEAESLARQAIQTTPRDQPDLLLSCRLALAQVLLRAARTEDAGVELDRIDAALAHDGSAASIRRARASWLRAQWLSLGNQFEAADPMYERAIAQAQQEEGPLSRLAADIRLQHATALLQRLKVDASKRQLSAALQTLRSLGGADDIRAAMAEAEATADMFDTAIGTQRVLPFGEAMSTLERLKEQMTALGSRVPATVHAWLDFYIGMLHGRMGDFAQAQRFMAPAFQVLRANADLREALGGGGIYILYGDIEGESGHHEHAEELLREALRIRVERFGAASPFTANRYADLAHNLAMAGRLREASSVLDGAPAIERVRGTDIGPDTYAENIQMQRSQQLIDNGEPWAGLAQLPPDHPNTDDGPLLNRRVLRAQAQCALGQAREAYPQLRRAAVTAAQGVWDYHPAVARMHALAGLCALGAGDRQGALAEAAQARAAFTRQPDVSPYFKAPWLELERQLSGPGRRSRPGH